MTSSNTNAMIALGFFLFTMIGLFVCVRLVMKKILVNPKEARYLLAT